MDYAVDLIQAFLSFLSPILVVIVTIRMERTRKADARIKKLEELLGGGRIFRPANGGQLGC